MVLVVGGGAGGRHVQCGNDAVDKLDAGYIRESGSEGGMERERESEWVGLGRKYCRSARLASGLGWMVVWWCAAVEGQVKGKVGTHLGEEVRITHNYLCLVKAVWEGRSG
jgi:hypothetical protein